MRENVGRESLLRGLLFVTAGGNSRPPEQGEGGAYPGQSEGEGEGGSDESLGAGEGVG